jgi:hypothetical protein
MEMSSEKKERCDQPGDWTFALQLGQFWDSLADFREPKKVSRTFRQKAAHIK